MDEPFTEHELALLNRAIDKMGWSEINAFWDQRQQSLHEDAGGYMLRKIKSLFGVKVTVDEVETYQGAMRAMIATNKRPLENTHGK